MAAKVSSCWAANSIKFALITLILTDFACFFYIVFFFFTAVR